MQVRELRRTALDSWLKAVRVPVDAATRLLPDGGTGSRNAVALVVDRADATVRDTVGGLLRDDELQADARRRRLAADERQRAIELRLEAEEKKRDADARLAKEQEAADRRREQADREAAERKQAAARERSEREQQAKRDAHAQQQAAERAREAKVAAAEKRAKQQRLRVLDQQEEALDERTDALTASDEAQRLRQAAGKAKAARKNGR